MRISTKGHYAVQAMVDMAGRSETLPVPLSVIAERQDLSQNYLEQLFVKLRKADLVKSVRGPGGGYLLARSPSHVTIGEVFAAVDESLRLTECVDESHCAKSDCCKAQVLWSRLHQHFNDLLNSITIEDVLSGSYDFSNIGSATVRNGL